MSKEFFINNISLTTLNLSYNLLGSQGVEYLTQYLITTNVKCGKKQVFPSPDSYGSEQG